MKRKAKTLKRNVIIKKNNKKERNKSILCSRSVHKQKYTYLFFVLLLVSLWKKNEKTNKRNAKLATNNKQKHTHGSKRDMFSTIMIKNVKIKSAICKDRKAAALYSFKNFT